MQKRLNLWIYSGLIFLFFLQTAVHGAEWYREYESGLELMKKGQYQEAIPKLQAAISQKSDEGINIKFYGMKFGDYVPHYLLGRAYFFRKDYGAALAEFQISEEQGAIFRKPELSKNLRELKTVAAAQTATARLPEHQTPSPGITTPVPTPVTEPVEKTSDRAQTSTEKIEDEPKSQQSQEKPAPPAPTLASKEPPRAKTSVPEPQVPELKRQEPISDPAKTRMHEGAMKYFEGDYDGAIEILSSVLKSTPDSVSAHFLLGCSYASKFLLTGSEDLQQKAASSFRKAKQINPQYSARDNPYISPLILRMFEHAGA